MDTKKLRQKILDLAIRGKLVPQDPNDEPASVLLERIRTEKERLIKEGKIKRSKKSASSDTPHYGNVPFEVPESWEWVRLDSIGDIVTGSTPPKDNKEFYGGDIPFYKPTDLEQGINTTTSTDSLTEEGFAVARQLPTDSILVTCIGATIGKTGMIRKAGTCNQQINAIVSFPNVFPNYIYYVCISDFMQSNIKDNASATTLPILNKNHFAELQIPLPPIEEQKRIVAAIEKWCSLIGTLETLKDELHTYITQTKSKILSLAIHGKLVPQDPNDEPAIELLKRINPKFTPCDNAQYPYDVPENWKWCKLTDLCSFLSRGKSPTYSDERIYPVFAQKCNLFGGDISLEQARFLDPNTLSKWPEEYKLRDGDVLVNSTGTGTVGRTRLFHSDVLGNFPFVVPDSHVSVVRTLDQIDSNYIYSIMSSRYGQEYIEDNLAGSTNQKELYIGVLENMLIPLPPYNEQLSIVAKIEELFAVLDEIQKSIEA